MEIPLFRNISYIRENYNNMGISIKYRDYLEKFTTVFCILTLISIIFFIIFGKYTRRIRVSGAVIPSKGIVRLFSPRQGRVVSASVKEGETIHKGQTLYSISSENVTELGETQVNIARYLRLQRREIEEEIKCRIFQDKIAKDSLLNPGKSLLKEMNQIQRRISVARHAADVQKSLSEDFQRLASKKLVQRGEAIRHLQNSLQAYQELEALQQQMVENEEKLSKVRMEVAGFDSKSQSTLSAFRRQILDIDRELVECEARRRAEIISPVDGVATAILVKPGQMVEAGAVLISILPTSGRMEIHLFANSSVIGFMHAGAKVLLRYSAFPYQKFGLHPGTVTGFSKATIRVGDVMNSGLDSLASGVKIANLGMYRIIVTPKDETVMAYGNIEPLRAGMEVEADIFLDTRYLYEWLLEPLYGLRGNNVNWGT